MVEGRQTASTLEEYAGETERIKTETNCPEG